jgi:hypothetical protein
MMKLTGNKRTILKSRVRSHPGADVAHASLNLTDKISNLTVSDLVQLATVLGIDCPTDNADAAYTAAKAAGVNTRGAMQQANALDYNAHPMAPQTDEDEDEAEAEAEDAATDANTPQNAPTTAEDAEPMDTATKTQDKAAADAVSAVLSPMGRGDMAAHYGRPFARISCDDQTESTTLLGMTVPDGKGGVKWQDGQLAAAIRRPGTVVLIDEPTVARAGAHYVFNALLDDERAIVSQETGERIRALAHRQYVLRFPVWAAQLPEQRQRRTHRCKVGLPNVRCAPFGCGLGVRSGGDAGRCCGPRWRANGWHVQFGGGHRGGPILYEDFKGGPVKS